ncbi:MAG TPA: serine hydrolase domain-containing protein [Gemmatimonadales bacterium]|nr:serine hydrolase domain-containing protein [Gemmatimonadales bacterium]
MRFWSLSATVLVLAACAGSPPPSPQPSAAQVSRYGRWAPVVAYLDSAVDHGAAPGAVVGVSWKGERFYYGTGRLGLKDDTRPDSTTVYDLASLTKVIGLTTISMIAVDEGKLDLDAPVQQYLPEFRGAHKSEVTIRHLLTHSSGLPAWRPLYTETTTREAALALADTTPLDTLPGTRFVYSDLGAIVMGQVIERIYGERLDTLLHDRVFGPLGMTSTRYLPPASWLPRIAPTEHDPWRGRTLRGEVHDENAARLGGVSAHAGLFSDAVDLLTFGEWELSALDPPAHPVKYAIAPPKSLPMFVKRQNIPPGSSRALGWDTPSGHSSGGSLIDPHAYGHTGFTGTSIWTDPSRQLVIVLLSNRVHPTRQNTHWGPVRAGVADRVIEATESTP